MSCPSCLAHICCQFGYSKEPLYGTILHVVFQAAVRRNLFTEEFVRAALQEEIRSSLDALYVRFQHVEADIAAIGTASGRARPLL
jgi:hypothetical protein